MGYVQAQSVSLRLCSAEDEQAYSECAGKYLLTSFSAREIGKSSSKLTSRRYFDISLTNPLFYAILYNDIPEPVGFITLTSPHHRANHRRAEIWYLTSAEFRNRGIMTAALTEYVEMSFENDDHNLTRIEAFVKSTNTGSLRVLEKAGFKKEALLRKYMGPEDGDDDQKHDVVVYGRLRSEREEADPGEYELPQGPKMQKLPDVILVPSEEEDQNKSYSRDIKLAGNGRDVGSIYLTAPHGVEDCHRRTLEYHGDGESILIAGLGKFLQTVLTDYTGLDRIESLVMVDDVSKRRVLENVGFLNEGVFQCYDEYGDDFIMYSFISTDEIPW